MRQSDGFSLVEVLVAASLTSLILLSLFGVFRVAQVAERQHQCGLDGAQNLRMAAATVAEDVRRAKSVESDGTNQVILSLSDRTATYRVAEDGNLTLAVSSSLYVVAEGLDSTASWLYKPDQTVSLHLVLTASSACKGSPLGPDAALDTRIAPYSLK